MNCKKICLGFLFALFFITTYCQDDNQGVKTIITQLEKFRKNYQQEKIHLHLDKPYYSIGDTIYFAAYAVNAEKNSPSVISNILYVDLINDSNNVIQTSKFPLTDGITYGSLYIDDSLKEGYYRIRSYTNWMRNFDDAFFYDVPIAVGNGYNDDIVLSPTYQFSNIEKPADAVALHFTSLHNIPLENKTVNYTIVLSKKEKINGNGIINNKRELVVDLKDPKLQNAGNALLVTHIKPDDKNIVTKEIQLHIPASKNTILFFPESGDLVETITSSIGFKATDANGSGVDVSGFVEDDSTKTKTVFQSGFAGIGSFQFTPETDHNYHVFVEYKNGIKEQMPLLKAKTFGYILSIDNSNADSILINISCRQTSMPGHIILAAQANNRMQLIKPVTLIDGKGRFNLSTKKFPTGILQVTLFDSALQPVAERLVFINHNDALKVNASFDKPAYNKREKSILKIHVLDKNGESVQGNFSVAVTDANVVTNSNNIQPNILADLLLTSDIKGYVENPNHYFDTINTTTVKELDDLLLTQGWRRFVWKDVLKDKYPSINFSIEKSLSINGAVTSLKDEPAAGRKVMLLPKKGEGYILDTTTDSNGKFSFSDLNFTDANPFLLQVEKTGKGADVQIKLDAFSPPAATNNKNLPAMQQSYNNIIMPYLIQKQQQYDTLRKYGLWHDEHQLKDVVVSTVKQTKIQQAVATSYNLNGPGNADQILTYEDFYNCHDVQTCLAGKITGVYFKMVVEDPAARIKVWHLLPFSTSGMGAPMMVVFDGVYLTAQNKTLDMRNIPVQNVQSIEVLRTGGYLNVYGLGGQGGVLVITSKQGGIDYDAERPGIVKKNLENVVFTTAKGYSAQREFYTPDYADVVELNSPVADKRTTIFWKPGVTTDDNGNATVEWYNADNTGNCNVVIEGVSADGKLGYAASVYKMQ